jgi:hypothetical protein
MGEMKKCGKTINHYEQDKNFLKFYNEDDNEYIIYDTSESYFTRLFKFLTSFTKIFK